MSNKAGDSIENLTVFVKHTVRNNALIRAIDMGC